MRVAILGGGGCFALNYARHALNDGHEVVGFGRSPLRGPEFTLDAESGGYRYRVFSIGPDNELLAQALRVFAPELIVNFAAQGEGAASFDPTHWRYFFATNAAAMVDLSARLVGLKSLRKFVEIGTSEIYGSVAEAATEDHPIRPTSPYAASKVSFDLHLRAVGRAGYLPACVLRPSNCYVPGQQMHRLIPRAMFAAVTGGRLPLHGGGRARKSYMHADDLNAAIDVVAARGDVGQAYNCGPDRPMEIIKVVEAIAASCGSQLANLVDLAPERTGEDGCYWLDSARIRALGWRPEVSLDAGLQSMQWWVRKYRDALTGAATEFRMRA